jgi:hypothetical protein
LPALDKATGLPIYSLDRTALIGAKVKPARRLIAEEPLPKSTSIDETVKTLLAIQHGQADLKTLALYAFGFFRYRDWTKREYVTAFCRRYEAGTEQFKAVTDPHYEYED